MSHLGVRVAVTRRGIFAPAAAVNSDTKIVGQAAYSGNVGDGLRAAESGGNRANSRGDGALRTKSSRYHLIFLSALTETWMASNWANGFRLLATITC